MAGHLSIYQVCFDDSALGGAVKDAFHAPATKRWDAGAHRVPALTVRHALMRRFFMRHKRFDGLLQHVVAQLSTSGLFNPDVGRAE